MDIATLQHELEVLPEEQQDRLAAFLTALRMKRDGVLSELCRRLDESDGAKWRSWDEIKAELQSDE